MSERGGTGDLTSPTDGDLLVRLYARDAEAFEALYDRYGAYVHGLALRMLGNPQEAEEATQDVFWQLWKGRVRYDPGRARFSTWLFAIARSRCLDRIRSRERRPAAEPLRPDEPDAFARDPEVHAQLSELRRLVKEALSKLPPMQKEAVELCLFEGMTHREVAAHLDEPLGTVKSRIKMAMDKLKLSLGRVEVRP